MNNLPLVAPARVDFSGIGDLPGHYMQAQNQAEQLRALAEGRQRDQQQRAAIGALDLEQPLTGQLGPLVQSGAVDPGKAFGLIQQERERQAAQQRTENIRRGLFGDGQNPGALARAGLTQEDIEVFSLMEPEEALKAYQEARRGTDDIQEYNFARQQGYGGTFQDFMLAGKRAGASRTSVNVDASQGPQVGTIPQGFQLNAVAGPDGSIAGYRMEPIPGGPADREIRAEADQAAQRGETQARQGGLVLEDIGRIRETIENSDLPVTGFLGNALKGLPGTDAYDVSALATTIRSNIGFDRLQQMREASPTGGALGNVTVQELERLESVLGSLDQAQTEDQFVHNLNRLETIYLDIIHGPGNRPKHNARTLRSKYGLE